MKHWGAHVTTSCSTDAVELAKRLGADEVIDYKSEDVTKRIQSESRCLIFHLSIKPAFLVQSFFETLQYCDEWRKFTSVIKSLSHQSFIVLNSGGGGVSQILLMCESL